MGGALASPFEGLTKYGLAVDAEGMFQALKIYDWQTTKVSEILSA